MSIDHNQNAKGTIYACLYYVPISCTKMNIGDNDNRSLNAHSLISDR